MGSGELEILRYLAPLGVGGVLAGIMFLIYRKDAREDKEAWRGQHAMMLSIVKENTVAITALITLVKERRR